MKHCHRCERTLNITDFGKNSSKKDGLQSQCKTCRREVNNLHYKKSEVRRNTIRKNNKLSIDEAKAVLDGIKENSSCPFCGEGSSCTLDFHHTNSSDKKFNVSHGVGRVSVKTLLSEIGKCILLCSNCHRKVHAGLLDINKLV